MDIKQPNWKVAADRATVGEQAELPSMPGYWIRPRKLSKQAEAELLACEQRRAARQNQALARAAIAARLRGADIDLSADEKAEALRSDMEHATAESVANLEAEELKIFFGTAEHNFNGDPEPATREWAHEVMGYSLVANDILAIIEGKNSPLPAGTSRISAM